MDKLFHQIDKYNKIIDKFNLIHLFGDVYLKALMLEIGQEIKFTGTTILKRIN